MLKTIIFIFLIVFVSLQSFAQQQLQFEKIRVIDGDTIETTNNFRKTKIRLLGYDAPELKQSFGKFCKDKIQEKLNLGQKTIIVFQEDLYRRRLGRVFVNSFDLSLEMIKSGCGWFRSDTDEISQSILDIYQSEFVKAQNDKVGLWIEDNPKHPRIWRLEEALRNAQRR